MNQFLSSNEVAKIKELTQIRQKNNDVSWLICDYLNDNACAITKEMMEEVNPNKEIPEQTIYFALLTFICGLDTQNNETDKQLANDYFRKAIKQLRIESYIENPYYKNIKIPQVKFCDWQFEYEKYQPYEAFIYNDIILEKDFKEIPCLGFFNKEFSFPAVMEHNHEWMAIKPNEIETMQSAIDIVKGKVITFGLGLGYFPYMASIKENVESITVIERDNEVIKLFKKYILPQFSQKEKIEIINADAFEFIEKVMPNKNYDYSFVDLWHDVSDGLEVYLKIKKLEYLFPKTKFLYWIEDSLLSGFRWKIFNSVVENSKSYYEIKKYLSNPFLKQLVTTKVCTSR
jgi:hypothetical protein